MKVADVKIPCFVFYGCRFGYFKSPLQLILRHSMDLYFIILFFIQSTVQLGFDFLSPESLGKAVKMAEEIRCLPNDHEAKLQVLEVRERKLSLEVFSASFIIFIVIMLSFLECYLRLFDLVKFLETH